jgi:rfaE bifunctional protein nucleotidyltransferase chain/domain
MEHLDMTGNWPRPLVFTNGCFDLLHVGHVRYLTAAKKLGQTLIVGLNSDQSVRQLKGPTRPVNGEQHRAEVLRALRAVDGVIIFSEPTADHLLEQLRPDFYVKGGDYQLEKLPEWDTAQRVGAKIVLVPVEVPISTTQLLARKGE